MVEAWLICKLGTQMFDYYQSMGSLLCLYGYVFNLHLVNFQIKIRFLYGRCFVFMYALIFKYMFQFWAGGCLVFLPIYISDLNSTPQLKSGVCSSNPPQTPSKFIQHSWPCWVEWILTLTQIPDQISLLLRFVCPI